jgi:hypothetical protein
MVAATHSIAHWLPPAMRATSLGQRTECSRAIFELPVSRTALNYIAKNYAATTLIRFYRVGSSVRTSRSAFDELSRRRDCPAGDFLVGSLAFVASRRASPRRRVRTSFRTTCESHGRSGRSSSGRCDAATSHVSCGDHPGFRRSPKGPRGHPHATTANRIIQWSFMLAPTGLV